MAVTRSKIPSPLKSPVATAVGNCPCSAWSVAGNVSRIERHDDEIADPIAAGLPVEVAVDLVAAGVGDRVEGGEAILASGQRRKLSVVVVPL